MGKQIFSPFSLVKKETFALEYLVFIQAAQSALGFEKETEIKDRKKITTVPRSNRKTTSFLAMGEESISYSQQVSSCLKII